MCNIFGSLSARGCRKSGVATRDNISLSLTLRVSKVYARVCRKERMKDANEKKNLEARLLFGMHFAHAAFAVPRHLK